MSFAHPWLLLGAAAALIPLLVHLFDRRRPRPQPFAPLSFVLRSQRRTASRLKLRRLLLYALRTFLFLAFPLALARPEWNRPGAAVAPTNGPAATALVLDASLSMRYRLGETLFERGRTEARAALSGLRANEPATLVVCGLGAPSRRAPTLDRAAVLADLDAAVPSYVAIDMSRCLEAAARTLEESPLPGKRLVVISDFTVRAFATNTPGPTLHGPDGKKVRPSIVLRDVAAGHPLLPNHALGALRIEPAPHAGPRAFQFTFSVRNYSSEPIHDLTAQLRVGDTEVTRGFVDVPGGGAVEKVFTHHFERGGLVQGEVTLAPDALPEDDRQDFVIRVPADVRALLINGAPSAIRHRDEAFFVDAALRASGSPVDLTVRDGEAGWREDFSHYGLILLLNVEAPPADVAERLIRFVDAGGGLFLSMGDRVVPEAYNARLGVLLPRPLRLIKSAGHPGESTGSAHLGDVDEQHPVFAPFTGNAQEGLSTARFFRYFLLEPQNSGGNSAARVLAAFDDGAPALVETHHGAGRVALWTSTVDRDWTDLPIRTSFLPLMQRLCAELSGALEEHDTVRAEVGTRITLPAVAGTTPAKLRTPSGAPLSLSPQGSGGAITPALPEPGVFSVLDGAGQVLPSLSFSAVLDPSESDLTRLLPEALSHRWGEDVVVTSTAGTNNAPVPLWTWILVACALALLSEGLILRGS